MTVVATITAGDVVEILAGCDYAVMAGATGAQNLRVVNRVGGDEGAGVVAVLAHICRTDVVAALANGIDTVVAADAIIDYAHMIEVCRTPRDRRMAVIAGVATGHMCRVLAGRDRAVVAAVACADDLRVINGEHGCEYVRRVTVLAYVARGNMRNALTRSIDTVMTVDAVPRDVQVIEVRWQPTRGCMAIVASIAAGDMSQVLPGCSDAVMATCTGTNHLCVVNGIGGRKDVGIVAILTNVAGLDMSEVLAGSVDTVVAVDAVIRDTGVVEVGRQPANGRMAIVAIVAALDVTEILPGRRQAIMAGATIAQHLRVIDREGGRPNVGGVAVLAHIRR